MRYDVEGIFKNIDQIELKLGEAVGPAVALELLIRLLAEGHGPLRNALEKIVDDEEDKLNNEWHAKLKIIEDDKLRLKVINTLKKPRINEKQYWNCNLDYLCRAILIVFADKLSPAEQEAIKSFRESRNKLLHADFVGLMIKMDIEPTGNEILKSGKRNVLKSQNIRESILSIEHNDGLGEFRTRANAVIPILEKLIRSVSFISE